MKKLYVLCQVLALACCYSCGTKTEMPNQVDEIRTFMNRYADLMKQGNGDSVASLLVDTSYVYTVNGEIQTINSDSIKAIYARSPLRVEEFRWSDVKITILAPNSALVTAYFHARNKKNSVTIKEAYTGVLVKENRSWKILHEHQSFDVNTWQPAPNSTTPLP